MLLSFSLDDGRQFVGSCLSRPFVPITSKAYLETLLCYDELVARTNHWPNLVNFNSRISFNHLDVLNN
jgi:hypothetical protein